MQTLLWALGSLRLCFRCLQCRNGITRQLDFHVFGYPELYAVGFKSHYRTVNPSGSDDLISCFEIVDHLLKLFLPSARRQENNEVKDSENEDERQKSNDASGLLGLLL
jgi:hypothetical protein